MKMFRFPAVQLVMDVCASKNRYPCKYITLLHQSFSESPFVIDSSSAVESLASLEVGQRMAALGTGCYN